MAFFGKVVLITGAASGIGKATAVMFAKAGAKLSLTDCNSEELQKVGKECELIGKNKPLLIIAELTNDDEFEKIFHETIANFSSLDVLINNAGTIGRGNIENVVLETFDKIMKINVRAAFRLISLSVPYLAKTKGVVINISSIFSRVCVPEALMYCMSKSTVDHMTNCLAVDLAKYGIRVNSINPGPVKTNLLQNDGINSAQIEMHHQNYIKNCPLKRMAEPEEIANAISFLCSDSASFITGINLIIDGGMHLRLSAS
ncbi:hypothetical protein PGB90_001124 [Kerria lacca]